jgi:hypothetical protein
LRGFQVPPDQKNRAAEILAWAEPMVRDRISFFWSEATRSPDAARAIAEQHWRVWRCALSGLPHGAAANRKELMILVRGAALTIATLEQGDEAVIDEIAEVIVARFRRSPHLAKDYTKALIMTAAGLVVARQASEAA